MGLNLEAGRLRLRSFQDSDLESFFAYRNDPEVARYQGWDVPYPRKKAVIFVKGMQAVDPTVRGEWVQVAVEERATGRMVGDVAYYIMKEEPQARIGFTLAREFWGKGYAGEAVRRLLAYLFDERNLHRVIAIADVENVPSYTLLARLGFRREAHFVKNTLFKGKWSSEYYYGMLQREWEQLRSE